MRPQIICLGLSRLQLQTLRCHFPILYEFFETSKESLDQEENIKQIVSTEGCVFINPRKISAQQLNAVVEFHKYAIAHSHASIVCFTNSFTEEQKSLLDTTQLLKVNLQKGRDKELRQIVKLMKKARTPCSDDFDTYKSNMFNDGWYLIDFETSGLEPLEDEIISFSISYMADYKVEFTKTLYVKPTVPLTQAIEEFTGIRNETLQDGISKKELVEFLKNLPSPSPWIVYSDGYFIPFLKSLFLSCGEKFDVPFIAMDELAALTFGYMGWHRAFDILPKLQESKKERVDVPHKYMQQLYDLTLAVFENLRERYDIRSFGELQSLYKD